MSVFKKLCFHTLVIIGLAFITFGAQAQAQVTVSIPDNIQAQVGTTITIPLTISQPAMTVSGFRVSIFFDPNVIRPLGPDPTGPAGARPALDTAGAQSANCEQTQQNTTTSGRIGIVGGNCAISGGGELIRVRFSVIGPAGSTTTLNLGEFIFEDNNAVNMGGVADNGSLTVLGPTAASVNLGGRVLTADGRGLRGAQVRLTAADGTTRTAMSSAFGYYRFADVQAGQSVTIQISSKKYAFQPQVVNVSGDQSDLNFVAQP